MSFINANIKGCEINPDQYHNQPARRGAKDFAMSPSALKEFARCPQRWMRGYNPPDSDAMQWGSLIDCLALTPDQFDSRYVIQPDTYTNEDGEVKPWKNNAHVCKQWRAEQAGMEIITKKSRLEAIEVVKALTADEIIASFMACSTKQMLVEAQWQDESGITIPVRCLLDLVPSPNSEFAKCLGDLKTLSTAALGPFQRKCFEFGWHVQAAFDTDLFVAATGEDRNTWCFVVQESYPPYQTGKRILSQDFLELGRSTYRRQLALYCRCLKTGVWPGYDDTDEAIQGWSLVNPDPWMESKSLFEPKLEVSEEPETEPEDIIP